MDEVLAFGAALLALRLTGRLLARARETRRPELVAWAASLAAYALAAAALAWGAAHGWDGRAFRVYYLFGGLLTAPLLGAGSLLLAGRRWAGPAALVYGGLAVGIAVAVPLHGLVTGHSVPAAQDHLTFLPARLVAIAANSAGAAAVVAIAVATLRRRPVGNVLIVTGVAVAAIGSGFGSLGTSGAAVSIAAAVVLLYGGFVTSATPRLLRRRRASAAPQALRER
jgi:hypothetical protein